MTKADRLLLFFPIKGQRGDFSPDYFFAGAGIVSVRSPGNRREFKEVTARGRCMMGEKQFDLSALRGALLLSQRGWALTDNFKVDYKQGTRGTLCVEAFWGLHKCCYSSVCLQPPYGCRTHSAFSSMSAPWSLVPVRMIDSSPTGNLSTPLCRISHRLMSPSVEFNNVSYSCASFRKGTKSLTDI